MVNKTYYISLDLRKVTAQPQAIAPLVEGDNGNIFVITLTNDGIPVDLSDCRVLCVFSKTSDGTTVEQDNEDAYVDIAEAGISIGGVPSADDEIEVESTESIVHIVSSPLSLDPVSVDEDAFREVFPEYGSYTFKYDGDQWKNGEHSVIISGFDDNIITIALKTASFGAGKNNCEIQIYSGDDRDVLVTTAQFNFDARKGIVNPDTIKSEQKYPILSQLLSTVTRLYSNVLKWIGVTASAQRTDGAAGVTLSEVGGHQHFAFDIPSDVAIGATAPTGQQSIWLKPDGGSYVLYYKLNGSWTGVSTIRGNGITSAVLNGDYTLTLNFDDGNSYTTPSIRGATGGLTSLVSTSYAYAVSDTATRPADSDFGSSVAPVQGKYYWTRTTFTFDNGMTPSAYACAYVGADGAVTSVNGQTGVVVLGAADVGAIPTSKLPSVITVTLTAAGWSSKAQTISNAEFVVSGFAYQVSPDPSDFTAYGEAQIYADKVTVSGQMTFHCDTEPTSDIDVIILKVGV